MIVRKIDELKAEIEKKTGQIIVEGHRAKRVHRAVSAMTKLPQLGVVLLTADPLHILALLVQARVGYRKFNAVRRVGPKLSLKMALRYKEASYTEPRGANAGQCVLELKGAGPQKIIGQPPAIIPNRDQKGRTPLMLKSKEGDLTGVRDLLNGGAEVDARSDKEKTALMYAAEKGHLEVVEELVHRGATISLRNKAGHTAAQEAAKKKHDKVVAYLRQQSSRRAVTSLRSNETWLLCDFHIHTSRYGSIAPVVDLYGSHGFDVICITDHVYDSAHAARKRQRKGTLYGPAEKANFAGHMKAIRREAKRAMQEYNMLVIPGVEITNSTNQYHIGVIDVKDWIDPDLSVEEVVTAAHAQGALAIGNHPHRPHSRHLAENWPKYDEVFDAWEVGNRGRIWDVGANEGLNHIASGDFHTANDFYSWKTLVQSKKGVNSVKEAIRDNSRVAIFLYGKG